MRVVKTRNYYPLLFIFFISGIPRQTTIFPTNEIILRRVNHNLRNLHPFLYRKFIILFLYTYNSIIAASLSFLIACLKLIRGTSRLYYFLHNLPFAKRLGCITNMYLDVIQNGPIIKLIFVSLLFGKNIKRYQMPNIRRIILILQFLQIYIMGNQYDSVQ